MVTQLQPDVRAYLHGGEVIKRYIKVEEVAYEYGFSVEETEYIAKAASSLYKLTRIHLVKKERFDEFMKHIYKVPGTNKQIIKKFARIGEASIIYSIGRHRFIELANMIVYNNFPWPSPTNDQKEKIRKTAQAILNARALYTDSNLADLYDPLTMPTELLKAHKANNRAVMHAYGFSIKMSEADCVAELMRMYQKLTKEK